VKRPLLNGDTGYSVATPIMPNPRGPHARDQGERGTWLVESCGGALGPPSFVGWHMCGVIDTWKTMPGKAGAQHQGLMTVRGTYYPEMERAVQDISKRMYRIAAGGRQQADATQGMIRSHRRTGREP